MEESSCAADEASIIANCLGNGKGTHMIPLLRGGAVGSCPIFRSRS